MSVPINLVLLFQSTAALNNKYFVILTTQGALLRSAYFLGQGPGVISSDDDDDDDGLDNAMKRGQVGILVCSKNSSPLTPTVR